VGFFQPFVILIKGYFMQRIKTFFLNLPPIFRNIFFLTGAAFAVWMLFFDENNMLVQYNRRHELVDLQKKNNFYSREIAKVDREYNELTTSSESQEKFARENYMMKKDNEDVFVIVAK
jgi:cell division protein FtsB